MRSLGGVPLYSGFMYAAVGSYVCQAWRRFDLRITGYRARTTALVAGLVYLNFFTSHVIWDLRLPLALRPAARDLADLGALHRRHAAATRCRSRCPSS